MTIPEHPEIPEARGGGGGGGGGGRRGIALLEAGVKHPPSKRIGRFSFGLEGVPDTLAPYLEPPAAPSPGYLGGADWQYDLGASPIPEWTAAPRRTLRKMRKVYGQQLRRPFSPPRYREFEHLPI